MKSHINLVAVGDIFINGILADLIHSGGCIEPFALVLDAITDTDIKFGNLVYYSYSHLIYLIFCCKHPTYLGIP